MAVLYKQRIGLMVCVLVHLALFCGCSAAIMSVSEKTYSHIRGDLLGILPEPLETAYAASIQAIESLEGYDVYAQNLNTLSGRIVAYDSAAQQVLIDLKKTEDNQTQVSIRIGILGDKLESVHIYDRIQYYLQHPAGSVANAKEVF